MTDLLLQVLTCLHFEVAKPRSSWRPTAMRSANPDQHRHVSPGVPLGAWATVTPLLCMTAAFIVVISAIVEPAFR